jgi:nucleotide-binding universal stress UspA family protein
MGTKGLKGIEKFLLGSVAENVLRHSKAPVMIVR